MSARPSKSSEVSKSGLKGRDWTNLWPLLPLFFGKVTSMFRIVFELATLKKLFDRQGLDKALYTSGLA